MKHKKIMLIYNPYSGKATIKQNLGDIVETLSDDTTTITVYPTKHQNHAKELVLAYANEYDLVVCCGGDGTLNEVINGLFSLTSPPALGYIPSGTVNDFASNYNLHQTPIKCAEIIKQGNLFSFDVGTLNNTAFAYFAGFGVFTDVSHQTSQEAKNTLGRTAYILEGLKRLASIASYTLTVIVDNEIIHGDFIFGMITNSVTVGGFKTHKSDNIKLNDGLFELTLAYKPKNNLEIQTLLQCILTGTESPKCLRKIKANSIKISSDTEVEWNIDGEYAGSYTNAVINNHKESLNITVDITEDNVED